MHDGAWLVDRMVIGKFWLIQDAMNARTNGGRVFWDRFWGRDNMDNPGSVNSVSNRDTISDQEVLATLSGLQPQESQMSLYLELLTSDISNHLLSNVPQEIDNQDQTPTSLGQPLAPAQSSMSSATPLCWQGGSASNWWT